MWMDLLEIYQSYLPFIYLLYTYFVPFDLGLLCLASTSSVMVLLYSWEYTIFLVFANFNCNTVLAILLNFIFRESVYKHTLAMITEHISIKHLHIL